MKLLLVEDEEILSKVIGKGLKKCGYAVDHAYDGEEALELFEINSYNLIILDLNIPKIDGIEVLKTIRKTNKDINVIILSARCDVEQKIEGLDSGANDYLTKPFDFGELDARIRCLLRRNFVQNNSIINCGEISMDTAQKLVYVNDTSIKLTKKEYGILEYLMHNKGKIISTEEIIEHVWDSESDPFSNAFKYHIHSIKKKIVPLLNNDEFIKNIRGQGYMVDEK